MKKQVIAGVMLATMMVGISANNSYAEYNEYRGDVPENGGSLDSPFVITEVNLRDNYLKVVYNGGIEGEVKLRNVDLLTWNPEAEANGNEDYMDWVLPAIHYSTPYYAYVVYNKSHYIFGNKFVKGVEEIINGGEMNNPIADSPNMKLYYSIYVGPNTQQTSFYTGKINYERCAGSRAFNREEMTCKAEMKADGSGIQYQPYMIETGERVEVPEDYDVVPEPDDGGEGGEIGDDNGEVGDISGDDGLGGGGDVTEVKATVAEQVATKQETTEQVVVMAQPTTRVGETVFARAVTRNSGTGEVEQMVVATPVDSKDSGNVTGDDATEVLGESLSSLGEIVEKKGDGWNGWGVLVSVLGAIGVVAVGWWLFVLVKRRRKDEADA